MTECTRRSFLVQASLGVAGGALVGGLTALPARATPTAPESARGAAGPVPVDGLIAHVRDVTAGEINVMVGTREVVHRDPALAQRLLAIAGGAR